MSAVRENVGQPVSASTIAAGAGAEVVASPVKLKGIWIVAAATAGSLELKDGDTNGPVLLDLDTPAGIGGHYIELPDGGINFSTALFATLTTATFATLFYR